MNGWFFVGALVGIAVTIALEVLLAVVFDLPSRGIDDDAPSASEVVAGHTSNVRVLPPAQAVKGQAPGSGLVPMAPPPPILDVRFTTDTTTPGGAA